MCLFRFKQSCGDHSQQGKTIAVQTNNGKRWQANPEATVGIEDMQTIICSHEGDVCKGPKKGEQALKELKMHLSTYQNYFE